jgi:hyperosmotically inducible periplasmic protein
MLARLMTAAVVALLMSSAPASAADSENLQLFRDVQRQVLRYPHFTIFDSVHANVNDGHVTLVGKVTMPYKKTDIEKRVANVAAVTGIDNQIEVLPVSQFDNELRFSIARAIYNNHNFRPYASMVNPPIHIIVDRGRVTLEGVVNSQVDRMLARSIASSFLAFDVKNELQTEAEVKAALEKL